MDESIKKAGNEPASPRRGLTRRRALEAVLVAGLGGVVTSIAPAVPPRQDPADLATLQPRVREMRHTLQAQVRQWAMQVEQGVLARPGEKPEDRFTYTVDVGQLMWFFAMARDFEPYKALRDFAADHLILNNAKDDPFTCGFVLWRHQKGLKPDASGTTEALRIARALWAGATAFNRAEDAELALTIVDGYARHQSVDQGIWLIRNYFNFGSRSFATNSFFIDYDPDFLRDLVAAHQNDAKRHQMLSDLAGNSYGAMRRAVAPSGLLYDVLQPELKTMYFDMDVSAFSPNDIIQTNNACTTAMTVARGDPSVAQGALTFIMSRLDGLHCHYYGRNGERVRPRPAGAPEYTAAVRLAAALGDQTATATLTQTALPYWEHIVSKPRSDDAWMASEALLGFQSVLDFKA